jgi:hypothetical protein
MSTKSSTLPVATPDQPAQDLQTELQAELAAAEAEAADVERRYAEAIAALERAVADADVPAVMRLRGEAEVVLPQQLGAARIRLLAGRAAVAAVAATEAEDGIRAADAAFEAARDAHEEARLRYDKAAGEYHAADNRRAWAKTEAGRARVHAQRLRDEHAAYVAGHEQDQQRRLRLLAGLPDLEEVSSG